MSSGYKKRTLKCTPFHQFAAKNPPGPGVLKYPPPRVQRRPLRHRAVMSVAKLSSSERRAALSLAGIFALRMFRALFSRYHPVFAVYARNLPNATPSRSGSRPRHLQRPRRSRLVPDTPGSALGPGGAQACHRRRTPGVRPGQRSGGHVPQPRRHRPGTLPPGHGCSGLGGAGAGGGPQPGAAAHQGDGDHRRDHRSRLRSGAGGGTHAGRLVRGAGHVLADGGAGGCGDPVVVCGRAPA